MFFTLKYSRVHVLSPCWIVKYFLFTFTTMDNIACHVISVCWSVPSPMHIFIGNWIFVYWKGNSIWCGKSLVVVVMVWIDIDMTQSPIEHSIFFIITIVQGEQCYKTLSDVSKRMIFGYVNVEKGKMLIWTIT